MPEVEAALMAGDLESIGLEGEPRQFAHRWDVRDDFDGDPVDCGWIGEDESGVWMTKHPDLALAESSDTLWEAIALWHAGVRELSASDVERLSVMTVVGLQVLTCASRREEMRLAKEEANGT